MRFGSVCSGIEAASVAWEPLGWKADWLAEIEPFPSAVLAHHYPETPNLGDMTQIARAILLGSVSAPDVLTGGTPCQAFSVAGMREGLTDPRGELTIKFVGLADAIDHVRESRGEKPSIVIWENVPGVLSDKGNAFGCFLGALAGEDCELLPPGKRWQNAGCVYGPKRTIAWRVLDAQYFGLAQRRQRVFVVASARAGFDPAEVLFERDSVRRDTPPSRETGQVLAETASGRAGAGSHGHDRNNGEPAVAVCPTLRAGGNSTDGDRPPGTDVDTADSLIVVHGTQDPCVSDMAFALGRNSGQENAVLSVALRGREGGSTAELGDELAGTLRASSGGGDKAHVLAPIVGLAFAENSRAELSYEDGDGGITGALSTGGGKPGQGTPSVQVGSAVRRLTPRECERLQGFPDDYTLIPWRGRSGGNCPDGPRYKAIGNSWAVPVARWVGLRVMRELGVLQ